MAGDPGGQPHNRTALILYGTETGNSQDAAIELGRMAERLHFYSWVSDMDSVELSDLSQFTFVVFVVSTFGQGEFPRNARKFWRYLLRKRLPPDCLSQVQFTTFGLGDSSYPQYNFSARKLHKRLEQLGACEFYPRGESDEQHEHGIYGTFLPWSVDIRKHLLVLFPLLNGLEPLASDVFLPPKHYLALLEGSGVNKNSGVIEGSGDVGPHRIARDGIKADSTVQTSDPQRTNNNPTLNVSNLRGMADQDLKTSQSPIMEASRENKDETTIIDLTRDSPEEDRKFNPSTPMEAKDTSSMIPTPSSNGPSNGPSTNSKAQYQSTMVFDNFAAQAAKQSAQPSKEHLRSNNQTENRSGIPRAPIISPYFVTSKKASTNTAMSEFKPIFQIEREEDRGPGDVEQLKKFGDGDTHKDETYPPDDLLPIPESFVIELLKQKRVTPESHWQDVRLLTFKIPAKYKYAPGDTLTIYPKNFPEDVNKLLKLQGWENVADQRLEVKINIRPPPGFRTSFFEMDAGTVRPIKDIYLLNEKPTIRELLTHHLDFTAIPKRSFFDFVQAFATTQRERDRIEELLNPVFTDEFFDYTTRPRRTILEVLEEFPGLKLPYPYITSIFPVIKGRQYSIASSRLCSYTEDKDNNTIQLLIAIVKYQTIIKKVRQGLTTRYVESMKEGAIIHTTLTSNPNFRKPPMPPMLPVMQPLIMIAPGTGVAPCRALIWETAQQYLDMDDIHPDTPIGEKVLFFGNRNSDADYFFKDEWRNAKFLKVDVYTAWSRAGTFYPKEYVQHIIRKHGRKIHELIMKGARIYVCGSSGKMPKGVREALIDVLDEHGPRDFVGDRRTSCESVLAMLEKDGRYIQETW